MVFVCALYSLLVFHDLLDPNELDEAVLADERDPLGG